jgi:hypothetical protein
MELLLEFIMGLLLEFIMGIYHGIYYWNLLWEFIHRIY